MKVKAGQIWGNKDSGAVIVIQPKEQPERFYAAVELNIDYSIPPTAVKKTAYQLGLFFKQNGYRKLGQIPEGLK